MASMYASAWEWYSSSSSSVGCCTLFSSTRLGGCGFSVSGMRPAQLRADGEKHRVALRVACNGLNTGAHRCRARVFGDLTASLATFLVPWRTIRAAVGADMASVIMILHTECRWLEMGPLFQEMQ